MRRIQREQRPVKGQLQVYKASFKFTRPASILQGPASVLLGCCLSIGFQGVRVPIFVVEKLEPGKVRKYAHLPSGLRENV